MSDKKGKGKGKAGSRRQSLCSCISPDVLPPRSERVTASTRTAVFALLDAAKTTHRVGGFRMPQDVYDAYLEALGSFFSTDEMVAFMRNRVPNLYLPEEGYVSGFTRFLNLLEGEDA
ncbi:unnamed protein product, partial [Brassica oleracea]